jgi:hypothetical protein
VTVRWNPADVAGAGHRVGDRNDDLGSGWIVADGDVESGFLGQSGEFEFPQPRAVSVGSATVGGDEDPAGVGVLLLAELLPPFIDGSYGEDRRVIVALRSRAGNGGVEGAGATRRAGMSG